MEKLKYLNSLALVATLVVLVGCGDTKEANASEISETQTTKSSSNEPFIKKYALKSANIEYKLTGSMDMMGSTAETTGTKTLIFSEYGSHEITELNKVENRNLMGDKKSIETHTLDYIKEAVVYKVNFNKKNIMRMNLPALATLMGAGDEDMIKKGEKLMLSMGGEKTGTDKVLGYECDVWSLMGGKQCLYKGVPLKIETNVMGVKSMEVATKAEFDVTIDKSIFKLPDFPIINAMDGSSIEKSKLAQMDEDAKKESIEKGKKMAELGAVLKESQEKIEANPNMSKEEKEQVMMEAVSNSKGMQSKIEKQKEMMPKVITLMKSYRDCLQDANSKSDAQTCDKEAQALAKKIGLDDEFEDEEEDPTAWTKEGRESIIKEMNQEIKMIEKTLPCIQKANSMMDLMKCNQQ